MADSTNPTTANKGERQPLLATSFSNSHTIDSASNTYSAESESTHSGYDGDESVFSDDSSEIDEDVLNGFAAKFGASIGPLGLDGAVTIAPPIRRFSISQYPYIDSRRRGSLALDPDQLPSGRARSHSTVSALKKPYAQWIEEIRSVEGAESSSDGEAVNGRKSKYLGGVSDARFWAVFASILLVYFVRSCSPSVFRELTISRWHALIALLWRLAIPQSPRISMHPILPRGSRLPFS
jgi:hypothetical protein